MSSESSTKPISPLAQRIADASLLRGEFTLRSGRTSSYYLDKYKFSTKPAYVSPMSTTGKGCVP